MNETQIGLDKPVCGQKAGSDTSLLPLVHGSTLQHGSPTMTRLAAVSQGGRLPNNRNQMTNNSVHDGSVMAALLNAPNNHPNLVNTSASPAINVRKRKISQEDFVVLRRKVSENHLVKLKRLQSRYADHASFLCFLQNNGHLADYSSWRQKLPAVPLNSYLKAHKLNPNDEDEDLYSELQAQNSAVFQTPMVGRQSQGEPKLNLPAPPSASPRTSTPLKMGSPPVKTVSPPTPASADAASNTSQEQIVERAKQEAHVMQRIGELQKDGIWAEKRLPKVHELPRAKAHWDYLIEEMMWLAADFAQERKWKKAAAKKCARMVQKHFQEKEMLAQKAVKAQEMQLKRIAGFIAREIKQFWSNVEKLVEFKQQTRLEEKRKKALDQHLSFIVDQTEKYSSLVAESMNTSHPSSPKHHSDVEFEPQGSSDDDEETIAKEEALSAGDRANVSDEIDALKRESELPLEDLLSDYLSKRDEMLSPSPSNEDSEFVASTQASSDDEETIQEQETTEGNVDYRQEISDLQAEASMDIDELKEKFNLPGESESNTKKASESKFDKLKVPNTEELDSDDEEDEDEDETEEEEDEEEDEEEEESSEEVDEENDIEEGSALKTLITDGGTPEKSRDEKDKEIDDAAAIAQSLQPKGNTLSSTSVVTKIPFLLKHPLREYQHIGLDWLVTMYDRKLNGILADEMGLGKTIQTIALIAHLACEKGNWGPHLIVVPTSVMLNWEIEFKKWCPAFKILTYYGSQKERKLKRSGWTKPNAFHICITSYKLVIQDHQSFRRKKWKYLILDEAQNIKNFKSQRWQLLLNFQTQRRLLLTGTPLQNNLMELWSLMHFLMPNVFESHREFKEWFSNPVTGMIEGNSEYNETIIKRLHKVLRPFLLRRLKSEVETQMPKKYEHIVMCRLSNRQRYLYDDFMSRAKTKETLASGNLLSVINVLMQLRKVCNHPNLFEVRPTVSPFQMERITYAVPSMIWSAFDYDPFKNVDYNCLSLKIIELESWLLAFIAHRMQRYKTPSDKIIQIDSAPPDPPVVPQGRVRIQVKKKTSLPIVTTNQFGIGTVRSAVLHVAGNNHRIITQLPPTKVGTSPLIKTVVGQSAGQGVTLRLANPTGAALPNYLQFFQQPGGTVKTISVASLTSTGQVVKSGDGTTRIVPQFAQLVNTPTGRQLVLSSPQVIPSQGGTTVMTTSGQRLTVVSKSGGTVTKIVTPTVAQINSARPIMRVPPLNITTASPTIPCNSITVTSNNATPSTSTVDSLAASAITVPSTSRNNIVTRLTVADATRPKPETRSEPTVPTITDPLVDERRKQRRANKLSILANVNERRCQALPLYGVDLVNSFTVKLFSNKNNWSWSGHMHCLRANFPEPKYYWSQTEALQDAIYSVEDRVAQLSDVFSRFVLFVPAVTAPSPEMHVSHPAPWKLHEERQVNNQLEKHFRKKTKLLHPIASAMATQFPDPRLIQYDCGKLQALDRLLRNLKVEHHRVLIFTQMTRMLDVLEAFLNFHGHIYLRLDGTTKVDQRQVLMERFNADKRIFCFILSTRSGGVGINLTGADTVIFYDSDWNPTMDAQAQDRCHRIGQTRDVHIYRLVSEKTVEENILKKANQKRMLGDLAIEGGNFTTAYFKSTTIQDLFNVDESENDASRRMAEVLQKDADKKTENSAQTASAEDKSAIGALESALAQAEDDTDVAAAKVAKAEAAAELAEFDENIPIETQEPELSKAELELNVLMQQLSGVERYAMRFIEETDSVWSAEQLAAAEAEIEMQKREWEQGRLAAMREEEQSLSDDSENEDIITYSASDARNQLWVSDDGKEIMPMWCPPTPPQDDGDVYIDQSLGLLYEQNIMTEAQLPPVFIKKEKKRTRVEAGLPEAGRTPVKVRQREDNTLMHTAPRSLFDRPSPALIKMRQELRLHRYRGSVMRPTFTSSTKIQLPVKPVPEPDHVPDWMIQEDWTILQAIQNIQELTLNLVVLSPGHLPNWDMVADLVNATSRTYRSPKQCRNRYESVIIPREEGKLIVDSPKKQKKTKTLYKLPQVKSGRPLRTSQLYVQDNNQTMTQVMNSRFEAIRSVSNRRAPTVKPLLVDPAMKNPKHAEVLAERSIDYDKPLTPIEVAAKRADRIAKEKMTAQGSSEQQITTIRVQQQQIQTAVAKSGVLTTPTITTIATLSTTTPSRTVTVQEIMASTNSARAVASSPTSQTTIVTPQRTTNLVSVQSSPIITPGVKGTKTISATQLQIYRQQQMIRQQQLRVLQSRGSVTPTQKVSVAVSASSPNQRVQQVKAAGITRTVSDSEMVALLKRQQAAKVGNPSSSLTSAQILAQAGLQVKNSFVRKPTTNFPNVNEAQQTSSGGVGQVTTLVKAVSATSLPVAGLTLPQMKAALGSGIKAGNVTQQIRQLSLQQQQQLIAQQRKIPQQKVTQIGQMATKSGATAQLIVQSQKSLPTTMTMQQIQQVMKHVQPQHVVAQGTTAQVLQHSVFTKAQGSQQARVIPVASSSQQPIKQAIQVLAKKVVTGGASGTRTVPSVTIDTSGRTSQATLSGTIKTSAASQQAILTQVSAVLQQQGKPITVRQPVRIQSTSTPLVAVAVSQAPTVLTIPPQDNNQQQ